MQYIQAEERAEERAEADNRPWTGARACSSFQLAPYRDSGFLSHSVEK